LLELNDALRSIGLVLELPAPLAHTDADSPEAIVRSAPAQALLLELLAHTQRDVAAPPADAAPVREQLAHRLDRWDRQVRRPAKRFDKLDDPARHRLRKHAKRLRYGAEFASALFERRAVKRYLKQMRAMQDTLGALIDTMVGLAAYTERAASDPAALFAVGWLAARRERQVAECEPALKDFRAAKQFWN